jgi:amino acid adenylation domain-containing protein
MIISSDLETDRERLQDVCLLPASFAQQRLWFLDQLEPQNAAYNMAASLRLNFALDVEALHACFHLLLERHEVLRTTFAVVDGQPMQMIVAHADISMPLVDLTGYTEVEREREAIRMANEQANQPFDLAQGSLLRRTLLKLEQEAYMLLLAVHHIIFDEWSMQILFQELAALYQTFTTGKPSPLPELPLQYADFAVWQQEMYAQGMLANDLAYWKKQLADLPETIDLPLDYARGDMTSSLGAALTVTLPHTLVAELKGLSQEQGVTLYMTFVAAFQTLLYRYSNQEELALGTVSAGRTLAETEPLIGFFANTLVLRADLTGEPTFRQLLARVRESVLEAQAHQDVPFDMLVKALRLERSAGQNPLFQVFLALDPPAPGLPHGWLADTVPYITQAAKFDLLLGLSEQPSGVVCHFEYAAQLFDAATIERMAAHWQTLLEGIISDPSQPIAELPLLTGVELRELLIDRNDTSRPFPQDICVHHLIEAQVARTPDAIAVTFGGQHLTYRELNSRANQLARYLAKQGVGPEVTVGLCMERSPELVVALLAILKAGGVYVPLDPSYPTARLAVMLRDCATRIILAQRHLLPKLNSVIAAESVGDIHVLCVDRESDWSNVQRESRENPVNEVNAENLAYIIYTSGSTGRPKGVMIPHRALCNHLFCFQEQFHLTPDDRMLLKTAISFDPSFNEFFAPLMAGGQVVIARPEGQRDSTYLVQTIIKNRITLLQVVPTLLQMLLLEADFRLCTSLRDVICGADVLASADVERFLSLLPAKLHNLYGPTEACIDATIFHCERGNTTSSVPIGRPEANTQVYILDKHMQPVPNGVRGELYIGGAGLARGYMNMPELTAERFVSNPFCTGRLDARLYKTGDLVRYQADGAIEFMGRADQQVKLRGFRVELGEIEAVIRAHPAVQEALVMLREDTPGNKRLIAYIVPREQQAVSASDLQSYAKQHLPAYMLPSAFVSLEQLPQMPNGKVDRKALPVPQQDVVTREVDTAFAAPETVAHYQLVAIWENLLETRPIGIRDNFFHLGGHSLLAAQLIQRIEQVFGRKLSLAALFAHPTIEQQALALAHEEQEGPGPRVPVIAVQARGKQRPFFYLHGDRTLGSFYCFTLARAWPRSAILRARAI